MDHLDDVWSGLIKAYARSLVTRRNFLKGCGMAGIAGGLAGMLPALWAGGCGSEVKSPEGLPESFTSYETTPTAAHRTLAERHSSVLLLGPPESEDLLALVTHLYTRESAELAARFPNKIYATLSELVRITGKNPEEIREILRPVVHQRHVILEVDRIFGGMAGHEWVDDLRKLLFDWYGLFRLAAPPVLGIQLPDKPEEIFESTTYLLSPIIPPMFEANFMSGLRSPWHERYAALFTRIFETGYLRSYIRDNGELTLLRTLPIQESLDGRLEIVDADRLSDLLDQVGDVVLVACQCATVKHLKGEPCKMKSKHPGNKPCIIAGPVARTLIELGWAEPATREEVLKSRAATADEGAIHITFNVASKDCFYVCACCLCCCQLLQMVRDFECPSLMAPPHFLPRLSLDDCILCRNCQRVCQTQAHDFSGGLHTLHIGRCVGCGQCLRACSKRYAPEEERPLSWKENPAFRNPVGMNLFLPELAVRMSGILAGVKKNRGDKSFIK